MTDRERSIRQERLARGWDDPYFDRRRRGAGYAEAKAAARAHARRQAARDLGELAADMARATGSGVARAARALARLFRRKPQTQLGRAIRGMKREIPAPSYEPRSLGRLSWVEPTDPAPIDAMTVEETRLGIVLREERLRRAAERRALAREAHRRLVQAEKQERPKLKVKR